MDEVMDDVSRDQKPLEDVNRKTEEFRNLGMENILGAITPKTAAILTKSLEGQEITADEGEHLFTMPETADIAALAVTADEIRKEASMAWEQT